MIFRMQLSPISTTAMQSAMPSSTLRSAVSSSSSPPSSAGEPTSASPPSCPAPASGASPPPPSLSALTTRARLTSASCTVPSCLALTAYFMIPSPPSTGYRTQWTVIWSSSGRGTWRYEKGSNRADSYPQLLNEQVDVLLYWPVKSASMIDISRWRWFDHQMSASSASGRPSESGASMYGFVSIRLRSSERPLSRNDRSSCASCCSLPAKDSLNLPIASLKDLGVRAGASRGADDFEEEPGPDALELGE
mmetsp:Transcript_5314/g.12051  ORF Transcript_5314/g.12051 Transcript_5314/m.12051 type:complete len:249 (+) Transcript_5314:1656-2402(+)